MRKTVSIIMMLSMLACFLSTAPRAALSGGVTVTGAGNVVGAGLDIFEVTLPTAESLNFMLDPQGLLTLEAGQSAPLRDLIGGQIVHLSDARIINNSSHSVKVSVELRIESTNGGYPGGAVASFIEFTYDDETTAGLVEAGGNTENNVLFFAVPSANSLASLQEEYVPADVGFIVSTEPRTLEFVLPAAQYIIDIGPSGETTSTQVPESGSGMSLQFGGRVNTNADWRDFTESGSSSTVTVYITYTLERSAIEDLSAPRVEGAPLMVAPMPEDALELLN